MSGALLSRRAALTGAASAGVAMIAGTAAVAAPAVNPRLTRAIALHVQTVTAMDRFDSEVETPARQAYGAAVRSLPPIPEVPHQSVATTFININHVEHRLSTHMIGAVGCARRVANDPTWSDMGDEVWRRANCELAALADKRDAIMAAHKARHDAAVRQLQVKHRLDALSERSQALSDREYGLWRVVIDMPATGLPDLLAKLNFAARTRNDEMADDVLEAIHADVRRLVGSVA